MLTSDNVYERLNILFRDVLDNDDLVLKHDTTAKDVEGWDSMANVQLMLGVERTSVGRPDAGAEERGRPGVRDRQGKRIGNIVRSARR